MISLWYLQIYNTALKHAPILTHIRSTLERLDLEGNHIASIPSGYFDNCSKINNINFRRNYLAKVPDLFGVAHSVGRLHFGFNQIADVGNLYKYHFPRLHLIDLNCNLLEFIYVQPRLKWPNVVSLHVEENPVKNIELSLPYDNVKRFWIALGVNRIICHTTSKWNHFCQRAVSRFSPGQTYIQINCTQNLYIVGTCNNGGELPDRRVALTYQSLRRDLFASADLLSIGLLGLNLSEIVIKTRTFSLKKTCLKMSTVKRR